MASVQAALDLAIDQMIDPNDIYVRAGAVGRDGSFANPFSTIMEGIKAVNIGGTDHILNGAYPVTFQILVNNTGITLVRLKHYQCNWVVNRTVVPQGGTK
ncbi:hypothetical protein ACIQYS_14150 [Psychrobacillus sp. NPDC096426]|uniref:hypothetical protein n=1 Tax=Psychrobacillus sp. NPDC096426 TaxID=3364491 RepID=UPI00380307FE